MVKPRHNRALKASRKVSTICILALAFVLNGCNGGVFDGRMSQGVIDFAVSYPYLAQDDFMRDFLPTEMNMVFKDNKFKSELSAGWGMFQTRFINNSNDMSLKHMVKLLNKKLFTTLDTTSIHKVLDDYPNYTIIELDETKTIAGLLCKKALIIYDEVETREFYIYYTNDINFENPNWSTPFVGIDGLLMEYEIKQFNLVSRMTATAVTEQEVSEDAFDVPSEYENVTFEELQSEMEDVLSTLE